MVQKEKIKRKVGRPKGTTNNPKGKNPYNTVDTIRRARLERIVGDFVRLACGRLERQDEQIADVWRDALDHYFVKVDKRFLSNFGGISYEKFYKAYFGLDSTLDGEQVFQVAFVGDDTYLLETELI